MQLWFILGCLAFYHPAAPSKANIHKYNVTRAGEAYGITVSVMAPEALTTGRIGVSIADADGQITAKSLHPQDLDFYATIKPRHAGEIWVRLDATTTVLEAARIKVDFVPLSLAASTSVAYLATGTDPKTAQTIELGRTVYGAADERPYVPETPADAYRALMSGFQWFRFTAPERKLVYFVLETPDRDVPPDVEIFDHDLTPYRQGASAYTPEATQNYPGLTPFRARIVEKGETYYIRVAANHPAYRLRTGLYDVPQGKDAHAAVKAGMDFLVNLGDAWHANTPRRGAVALRNTLPHAEPQSCIACHPTQFTTRGYLTAVKNGYPDTRKTALDFLLTRLQNNPRPLYGHEGANWARVIYSARTVASRVSVLLDMAGRGDTSVTQGYARFLNLHDDARTELDASEPDGCNPSVSPFEIALQTWQTYGLAHQPGRQREIERQLVDRAPANVIDLAWKLTAFATMGNHPTAPLVAELYRWQRPDGRYPMQFDQVSPAADFITFQALYALALAGERPEATLTYALKAQKSDGSWQGDPVYKGFDTPFRDTQFAVMALSTLFPLPAVKPPAPVAARTEHLDELLAGLDLASFGETQRILRESSWVLARQAAAEKLGRERDRSAIPVLAGALGDPSKLVQRASAAALRTIEGSGPALTAALHSPNGRVRWGALRAFHDEFRNLTADASLLDGVKAALRDPVPQNRFQAADALWRWYHWTRDNSILEAVSGRMGDEADPAVRRGLQESVYNMLDENEGQLAAWQRTMAREEDRQAVERALHANRRIQGEILARRLVSGNRAARLGLLNSLWDFHVRHMAIPDDNREKVDVILPAFYANYSAGVPRLHEAGFEYAPYRETADFRYSARNGFQLVRVGNDADTIHWFADSGPALERALLVCLRGADRETTLQVIRAGSVLGDAVTPEFTGAMLALLESKDREVTAAVRYVYEDEARGKLALAETVTGLATRLLQSKQPDALAVVLPLLAKLPPGDAFTHDPYLAGAMEALLADTKAPRFDRVLRAAAQFGNIADSPLMRAQILEVLKSGNEQAGQAALDLVLSRYVTDARLTALTSQFIGAASGRLRAMMIDQFDPDKYSLRITAANSYRTGGDAPLPADGNLFSSPLVVETVANGLTSPDRNVREAATDLVSAQERLRQEPSVQAHFHAPDRPLPDLAFFRERVEPILRKPGTDGKACVMCHASHAVFRLSAKGTEDNYRNALKVVSVNQPRKSLLLIKPVKPNDSVADPTLYLGTHNGGERWAGNEASPEYQTILEWIRGAKLDGGPAARPVSVPAPSPQP